MGTGGPGWNPIAAGVTVAGKFRLESPLGQGGMGAVWRAVHTSLQTPCALKFLHASVASSESIRARFEREAVAAAQLRSPHVVQILDHGVWEGAPYIAMELLDGEDLGQRLRRVGVLSLQETALVVSQVARALQRAHAAGLVHRDLKPANIFLVRDDDREIAKVLDFGVAKIEGMEIDEMTKTGALLGTPYYMSPEQSQGSKSVDFRSDLWALGVVTFQCLTGQLPFFAQAAGELFMRIIVRPLPVPSEVAAVPPGFDAWWARAACRDPDGRFQSAREMSDALFLALGLSAGVAGDIGARTADPRFDARGDRVSAATPPPGTPVGMYGTLATPASVSRNPPSPPSNASGMAASVAPLPSLAGEPRPSRPPGRLIGIACAAVVALSVAAFFAWRSATGATQSPMPAATAEPAPATATAAAPPAIPSATPEPAAPIVTASATASASAAPSAVSSAAVEPPRRPSRPPAAPASPPPAAAKKNPFSGRD